MPTSTQPVVRHAARASGLAILPLILTTSALALETRFPQGEISTVTVGGEETVSDTLLAGAEAIEIHGTVTGNLLAFARRVVIDGTVQGDLITGAQTVEIRGTVGGNVLSFSRQANISGQVSQSLHVFAELVRLHRSGRTAGDMIAFASEITAEGRVDRDLYAFAGETHVQGEIGGDLVARTGRLSVSSPARVEGDLRAHVNREEQVSVAPGAVAGNTQITLPEPKETTSRFLTPGFYLWQLARLGAAFTTGMVLFWLFPSWFAAEAETLPAILRTLGSGFLVLVVTPFAVILIALTIVGLPVALFTLVLWLASLYAALIFAGAWLGEALLHSGRQNFKAFGISLLAGLGVLIALTAAPYLGFLARFGVLLLGLGLLARALRGRRVMRRAEI